MRRILVVSVLSVMLVLVGCSKKSQPVSTTENNNQSQATPPETPPPQAEPAPAEPAPPIEPTATKPKRLAPRPKAVVTAQVPQPPPEPTVIPPGTVITVRLQQPVSSKSSKVGDRFAANLSEPIALKGQAIAPTGTEVGGTVTNAKAAGKFKGEAALHLKVDTIVIHGTRYQVTTEEIAQTSKGKGKRSATMIGGGTGAGALIGGLAGGGKGAAIGAVVGAGAGTAGAALTGNNNEITLPAESALSFKLTAPLTLKQVASNTAATE
jgi:hypothetical protein